MLIRHPQAVKVIRDNIHAGAGSHSNNAITSLVFLYTRREWGGYDVVPVGCAGRGGKMALLVKRWHVSVSRLLAVLSTDT